MHIFLIITNIFLSFILFIASLISIFPNNHNNPHTRKTAHIPTNYVNPSPSSQNTSEVNIISESKAASVAGLSIDPQIPEKVSKIQNIDLDPVSDSQESMYILSEVNTYRASKGLSPVLSHETVCNFAKIRASEISQNFNHDNFQNRIKNNTLPYTSFQDVTENIAFTTDYHDVISLWINSPLHAKNMEKDTPYVCIEKQGIYYAYEGWKP